MKRQSPCTLDAPGRETQSKLFYDRGRRALLIFGRSMASKSRTGIWRVPAGGALQGEEGGYFLAQYELRHGGQKRLGCVGIYVPVPQGRVGTVKC